MSRFRGWFYNFYTIGDLVKGIIAYIILTIVLIPLYMFGFSLYADGTGAITYIVVAVVIHSFNTAYFIYAVIKFIIYRYKYGKAKPKKSLTTAEMFSIPREYLDQ